MRTRSIAFRAAGVAGAAGTAAALLLAPAAGPARAHDSVSATVSPARVTPGDRVEILVHGCRGGTGLATSPAFSGPAELRRSDARTQERYEARDTGSAEQGRSGSYGSRSGSALSGHTVVKARLSPGSHAVTVRCDGHDHRAAGTFQSVGGVGGTDDPARPAHPSPVAPVRAGGGGTAALAAAERRQQDSDGPGTPHTIIGLVLAGVAAVAVAIRTSRRRRPGSD
ncbi:hypothetical protein ABZ348_21995 [Streptomyces sp. NPDC005963]|uniref:hypothetical protein n=1 Tax=Streptomyces sp. NPDC005963 TaxID=3156721 RepID=UPI0033FBAD04